MPTVPRATAQVQPEGLPGPRLSTDVTPDSFGAGVGRLTSRASLAMIEDDRRKANDMAVMVASNSLKSYSTALLYDPKNGMLNKRGQDSFNAQSQSMQMFDQRVGDIESSLTTEDQKDAFRKHAFMLRGDTDLAVQRHVSTQMREFDKEQFTSFMGNSYAAVTGAVASNDFAKVGFEIASQQTEAAKYAERNGLGAEWVKAATQSSASKTHYMVVETLAASGQDQAASQYLKLHGDAVIGEDKIHALKLVETSGFQGESQRIAEAVIQKGMNEGVTGGVPREDMYNDAKERTANLDPKVRDAVMARLDHEFIRQDKTERERHDQVSSQAINMIEGGTAFDDLPAPLMSALSVTDRAALRAYSKSKAKGENIETDWEKWYARMDEASHPATQAKFMSRNLMADRSSMADAQFQGLVHLQASMRNQDNKKGDGTIGDEELTGYRTNKQIVDDQLTSLGFDITPKAGSQQSQDVTKFRRTVDEQIVQFKAQHNRKPNFKEVEDIVDTLTVKGVIKGQGMFSFDKTKYAFQLTGDEALSISIKDIPQRHLQAIQRELQRIGQPVTNDRIISYYNTRLQLMLHNK